MNAATILRRSADRLRSQGWKRKQIGSKHGESCLMGAILWEIDDITNPNLRSAVLERSFNMVRAVLIERGVELTPRNHRTMLMNWNDAQESIDPILEVLELAASRPESQADIDHS